MHGMPYFTILLVSTTAILTAVISVSMILIFLQRGRKVKAKLIPKPEKMISPTATSALPPIPEAIPSGRRVLRQTTEELRSIFDSTATPLQRNPNKESWDIRSLSEASSTDVKNVFSNITFDEALGLLSCIGSYQRKAVLDQLELKAPFRRRLENGLKKLSRAT